MWFYWLSSTSKLPLSTHSGNRSKAEDACYMKQWRKYTLLDRRLSGLRLQSIPRGFIARKDLSSTGQMPTAKALLNTWQRQCVNTGLEYILLTLPLSKFSFRCRLPLGGTSSGNVSDTLKTPGNRFVKPSIRATQPGEVAAWNYGLPRRENEGTWV